MNFGGGVWFQSNVHLDQVRIEMRDSARTGIEITCKNERGGETGIGRLWHRITMDGLPFMPNNHLQLQSLTFVTQLCNT
jgi:hypothetical protein